MNLLKIQDMLKGAPDHALVGYVQNPTGQVPTYLALSELQRRKEMRASYQENKPEQKSVAEDLVQESQPKLAGVAALPAGQPMQQAMQPPAEMPVAQMAQGGLADLSMNNQMFNEENFATGGIVAFDDGGDVKHYDGTSGSAVNAFGYPRGQSLMDRIFPSKFKDASPAIIPQLMGEKARLEKEIQADPSKRAVNYQRMNEIDTQIAEAKAPITNGYVMPTGTTPKLTDEEVAAKVITDNKLPTVEKNPFDTYKSSNVPVEKIGSLASYADEFKNYVGTDPMKQKLADRLATMEDKATKQEEQAPWMALAKAGFEMASSRPEYGKGQSAIADIARGAGVGIKDYGEAKDKLNTLEEKRFNIENELAKAQRAETFATAKFGADSRQAAEARAQAASLHNSSMDTQMKIAQMNATISLGNKQVTNRGAAEQKAFQRFQLEKGKDATLEDPANKAIYYQILKEEYARLGVTPGSEIPTSSNTDVSKWTVKTK